jgi:hypothetical protein
MLTEILMKYSSELGRWRSKFSHGRDVFKIWTTLFIDFLIVNLAPQDLYYHLVQCGFINSSKVQCNECLKPMDVQTNNEKTNKLQFVCKNKVFDKQSRRLKMCGKRKSILCNSWFANSKLNLDKICGMIINLIILNYS